MRPVLGGDWTSRMASLRTSSVPRMTARITACLRLAATSSPRQSTTVTRNSSGMSGSRDAEAREGEGGGGRVDSGQRPYLEPFALDLDLVIDLRDGGKAPGDDQDADIADRDTGGGGILCREAVAHAVELPRLRRGRQRVTGFVEAGRLLAPERAGAELTPEAARDLRPDGVEEAHAPAIFSRSLPRSQLGRATTPWSARCWRSSSMLIMAKSGLPSGRCLRRASTGLSRMKTSGCILTRPCS